MVYVCVSTLQNVRLMPNVCQEIRFSALDIYTNISQLFSQPTAHTSFPQYLVVDEVQSA